MVSLLNHPQLSCLIDESDEDCLKFLTKIDVDQTSKDVEEKTADGKTFMKSLNHCINFYFSENPYFENTVLSKSYFQVMDEVISEGDEIKWKEGKNLIEITRNKPSAGTVAAKKD